MADRITDLHPKLKRLISNDHVYFQPPENMVLEYDCFIYSYSVPSVRYADNRRYSRRRQYTLIYITKNPDSPLIDQIPDEFSYCRFDRHYVSSNLNYYVYSLYY